MSGFGFFRYRNLSVVATLLLCGLSVPAWAAPAVPPPASGTARIWVYRTFEPSVSRGLATVAVDERQMDHLGQW
jgi:hypothetical protein